MAEEEVEELLEQELWIKDKFKVRVRFTVVSYLFIILLTVSQEWKRAKDDEMRVKMAQSGRYKQYRRYMKNHGNDRMTFDDS